MSKASDRLQAKVTKLYIDMRLKRISKLNWMMETEQTIEALRLEQSDISAELFYAQLLITREAYDAAEEILEQAAEWLRVYSGQAPALHAYYLYLTTLVGDDASYDARVAGKLTELAGKYQDIWQIQWLLYYVDRNLAENPLDQYHFLKKMFLRGCRSPLMYLEARALLERNPTFLYEFSEFEVQLMVFMIRHAGMSQKVSDILAEYMLSRTDYRYLYLVILCGCYEVAPSKRILENICRMLVLGGCTGSRFTLWYRKGIYENVRVSGLFEAFMKSLPVEQWYMDGEELSDTRRIPGEALEYFAHSSGLDEVRTAYLYAVVHKYKDNWFSTYRKYEPLIQPFMMDQLYKGHVNAGLAYLYEHLLDVSQLPKEQIENFLDICHSSRVCNLPVEAGTLVVNYIHSTQELRQSIVNGEAQLPLYGEQFTWHVENYNGYPVSAPDAYSVPFVNKDLWQDFFKKQKITNILYHMSNVEKALAAGVLEEEIPSVKYVFTNEVIQQSFKEEVAAGILAYWDVNGAYDEILEAAPYVFSELGTYNKDKETLFWKTQYLQNYIGIYGMQFLLDHYEGTLQEQSNIFTKAKSLGIETGGYAEGLLLEMMQSGQMIIQHQEVLEAYYAMPERDTHLLQAYLEFVAREYYLSEKIIESDILQKQALLTKEGCEFAVIAKLGFLQGVVNKGVGNLSQEMTEAAQQYMEELLREQIYFHWMQPLQVICPKLLSREAYQVLEYRGNAKGPVWVRFSRYSLGCQEAESFQSEVMEQVCQGVYAKGFILFYGERMHYEIFCLDGTEHQLLKQGVLQRGQVLSEPSGSRFSKLNHMLQLREAHSHTELYQELQAYYSREAMVEQLFTLK